MTNPRRVQIGDVIVGEFKVLDIFGGEGKSGMGVVYLVEERDRPYPIVLKTFQKDNKNSIDRFKAEAKTWISLGIHPNLVEAFFVREINEQLFVGAEYIPPDEYGRNTVTHYLKQGGISNIYAIKWLAQFCYAMKFAFARGLKAHRDIKPDNLMIDNIGNLKVTDFGLAKAFEAIVIGDNQSSPSTNHNLTSEGYFLGTLLYASPEQISEPSSVDHRSDIYSFGIVLYQLISLGSFPYSLEGKTTQESIALMHFVDPVIEINHPLFSIVRKCLEKQVEKRYQSFDQILHDLSLIGDQLGIELPSVDLPDDCLDKERFRQALSLFNLGEKEKALDLLGKYQDDNIYDSAGWQLLGTFLMEMGRPNLALTATLKAQEFNPNSSQILNNLGLIYGRIGEQEKGIEFLIEAIKVDGYNSGAALNLAVAFAKVGHFSAAAEVILKALTLTPDKKLLHFNAGNIAASAMQEGKHGQAIEILEKLIELDPEGPHHLFNLGNGYRLTGQIPRAITCYERVLKTKPLDEEVLLLLAQLNDQIGRFDEVSIHCETLLDNGLAMLKAMSLKAKAMQKNGQGRQAINMVKQILSNPHNQNNDAPWVLLATLYEMEGHFDQSLASLKKAKLLLTKRDNIDQDNVDYLEGKIRQISQQIDGHN